MSAWMPLLAVAIALATANVAMRRWWQRLVVGRFEARPRRRSWRSWRFGGLGGMPSRLTSRLSRSPDPADDVASTLHELARAVAGGSSLPTAIESLGPPDRNRPFAQLVGAALVDHRLGTPLGDALGTARARADAEPWRRRGRRRRPGRRSGKHRRRPSAPEPALGLTVLEVAARHGGSIAATLERATSTVRERRAVVAERAVQSAQARLSAVVLTVLPFAFALWTAATNRRAAHFLFGSPLGAACLAIGAVLNLSGWVWMRRIIRGRP